MWFEGDWVYDYVYEEEYVIAIMSQDDNYIYDETEYKKWEWQDNLKFSILVNVSSGTIHLVAICFGLRFTKTWRDSRGRVFFHLSFFFLTFSISPFVFFLCRVNLQNGHSIWLRTLSWSHFPLFLFTPLYIRILFLLWVYQIPMDHYLVTK